MSQIKVATVVKEFADVFQDTELFRVATIECQMAISRNDQEFLEKRYAEMKDIFAKLSKEMRELDVQIRRHSH